MTTFLSWLLLLSCAVLAAGKISVGAIRWDAWYGAPPGNAGIVGRTVTADLGPARWHYRLPFFATIASNDTVTVNGDSDAVMDAEVAYAKQFGIDFWAYCAYPIGCKDYSPPASECPYIQCCADNYALSYALTRHVRRKLDMGFALILQYNWFPGCDHGGNETLAEEVARYVSYFAMPTYKRTPRGAHPIVFLFGGSKDANGPALLALRNATLAAGLPCPYFVYMGGDAKSAVRAAAELNASAITRYASIKDGSAAAVPFADNAAFEQQFWNDARALDAQLIPPVTAGWDPRPRFDYPVPWSPPQPECGPVGDEKCYTQDPTMAQLTNLTAAALAFAKAYPETVSTGSILISAWNEHDEGHWIAPSLLDGTQKLQAVYAAIRAQDTL